MGWKEKMQAAKPSSALFHSLTQEEKAVNAVMADISYHIMDERRRRGMSQKEFAKLLGVSQGMVSRWESCDYNFSLEKAVSLFSRLGLTVELQIRSDEANETQFKQPPQYNAYVVNFPMGVSMDYLGQAV